MLLKMNHLHLKNLRLSWTRSGRSLLHLAVDSLAGDKGCGLRYPCPFTTSVLLEASADPSTTDDNLDTPLHLIVSYKQVVSNFQSLLSTARILVKAGTILYSPHNAISIRRK